MTRCGDCGTETQIRGRYRICDTCGTKTRLAPKPRPAPKPQKEEKPLPGDDIRSLALVELHHKELGQCPHCLHPRPQCQCDKENE